MCVPYKSPLGDLSGRLSATIFSGNFWKGTRQGLITNGLNHAVCHIVKWLKVTFSCNINGMRNFNVTEHFKGITNSFSVKLKLY